MPIRHAVWKVGPNATPLREVALESEKTLEEMIIKNPEILSERWMIIGQQVQTTHGGYIDLLGLNQDGQIIVIELKRDRTPREVVAQALDYASWVQSLSVTDVADIFSRFSGGQSLDEAYAERYGMELDEELLNGSHQIVVVASSLDLSTERIVTYLNDRDLPINVIFFQVFEDGSQQYLSRAWLIDPVETESKATSRGSEHREWNGEFYVSFGHDHNRDWEEARRYGFISAGHGSWYTRTLSLLTPGDRIWVNIPRRGFVGVGVVTGDSTRADLFTVSEGNKHVSFLEVAKAAYLRDLMHDEELAEYFVPIDWIDTKPIEEAVSEVGFFGNQNTVCRPTTNKWDHTVGRLKRVFDVPNAQ